MPPFIPNFCNISRINDKLILVPCTAPEEQWNTILIKGLTVGGGDVSPEELYAVVNKRVERTLIRTVRQSHAIVYLVHVLSFSSA